MRGERVSVNIDNRPDGRAQVEGNVQRGCRSRAFGVVVGASRGDEDEGRVGKGKTAPKSRKASLLDG